MITAELPDGRQLEFPDGTDPVVVQRTVKKLLGVSAAQEIENDPITKSAKDFTSGMTTAGKFNAGVGKAFADLGHGFAQLLGRGPSAGETSDTAARDRPLMNTGAGLAGNVVGNVAALAPLAVVPGANTLAGAGAIGATLGALQPATGVPERLANMGVGGALSAGGQWLGTTGAGLMGERAARQDAAARALQSARSVEDETLAMGRQAGYVIPPSAVNQSFLNRRIESVAGKAAIGQEASNRNQDVTIALAKAHASIPEASSLNERTLAVARKDLAQPYRDIAALSEPAAKAIEKLKQAQFDAKEAWRFYDRSGDPGVRSRAELLDRVKDAAEAEIERLAVHAGKPELVPALAEARTKIAQNWDVDRAFNVGSGDVRASVFGNLLDKGRPVTGPGEMIGRMQQAFPMYMREGAKIPTPGVSKSEALASAILGIGGAAATGNIYGAAAGALPMLSTPARNLILSKGYQNAMTQPSYGGAGLLTRIASQIEPEQAGLFGRTILPALYFGSE